MIRINLLSVEKPVAATASAGPKFSLNLSQKAGPIAALFVLAGCLGYTVLDYLNLQRQDAALHQELIAARAEKARLQPILKEVERFDSHVELFDPFKKVSFDADKFGVMSAADVQATSAVAVGLALRKVGDR